MVKRSRLTHNSPAESPVRQDPASKASTLESVYGPLASRSRVKTASRPTPLRVELLPIPSFAFIGMSPITSFLASSRHNYFNALTRADPEENINQCEIKDERVNYNTLQGVKYDIYPHDDVPHSMLYDNVTPENQLHSYELIRRLTSDASPSLLHIPNSSPVCNALDLGSGDGHWIAHAAQVWGAHGTKITGIHMPLSTDEEQTLLGRDTENVTVLRHNFITERLPFPDRSFDYVRLNDTMAAIPGNRWDFVLSEVYRVLSLGGRFELIHDQLCFSSIGPETPFSCTFAPSTNSLDPPPNFFEVAKRKSGMKNEPLPHSKKSPYEDWEAEMRNCNDIERLYLDMLAQKYDVHPQPYAILVDTIRRRFGSKGLVNASDAHVCLPSQEFMVRSSRAGHPKSAKSKKREFSISITIDWGEDKSSKTTGKLPAAPQARPSKSLSLTGLPPVLSKKAANLMGVTQLSPVGATYRPPGVVVVRSSSEGTRHMTFYRTSPTELDMHSNKHAHSIISAKLALEAHVDQLRKNGKRSMPREALDDALWQYAMFRRKRFNWPETDSFEWESESESDGESKDQIRHFTLPDTQTTDGLTPVRLFQIFEVIKSI